MEFNTQEQVNKYFKEKFSEKNKTLKTFDNSRDELLNAQEQGYSIEKYERKFNQLTAFLQNIHLN